MEGQMGTDIISRDMTLAAVPLQLLSHFSPTCTVIIRQYLARPATMAVSTVKNSTVNVRKCSKWPIVYPPHPISIRGNNRLVA